MDASVSQRNDTIMARVGEYVGAGKIEFTGDNGVRKATIDALASIIEQMRRDHRAATNVGVFGRWCKVEAKIGDESKVIELDQTASVAGHEVEFPDGRYICMNRFEWVAVALFATMDATMSNPVVRALRTQLIRGFAGPIFKAVDELSAKLHGIEDADGGWLGTCPSGRLKCPCQCPSEGGAHDRA